jgi:hypothetical protein
MTEAHPSSNDCLCFLPRMLLVLIGDDPKSCVQDENLRLQNEIRRMERGLSTQEDARGVRHLRAEVVHLKACNCKLRSENESLCTTSQVCAISITLLFVSFALLIEALMI